MRDQLLVVVRRNGKYFTKRGGWVGDVTNAHVWPLNQARSVARIDIGMPCELVEIVPTLDPLGKTHYA